MWCRSIGLICGVVLLAALLGFPSPAGANPCAANPCAAKAANPCAANPCAAKPANPCAAAAMAAAPKAKAVTMLAQVVRVELGQNLLVIEHAGQTYSLSVDRRTLFTQGTQKRSFGDLRPEGGDRVTVSFLDYGSQKKARYVYIAKAGAGMVANPCAANPCAAKPVNPCAPKAANPCAANPCAAKAANPCAANPCAPKK
ncbi:MAG: hypothetical protein HYY89_05105 [candidate division NC10 bacterium]|nr:hypothetical protein [candidate division NC10 bacterium]